MSDFLVKEADFSKIADVHAQIPEFSPLNPSDFEERCREKPTLALIAYYDGNPAGYTVSYDRYKDDSLYIWMAAVLPAYRNKGTYSALEAHTGAWAHKNGFKALRIKTRNNRREMLGWLIKNGYDFIDIEPREDIHDNRLLLYKPIKD